MAPSLTTILLSALAAVGTVRALPQAKASNVQKRGDSLDLIQQLELAPTSVDRFKLLLGDGKDAQDKIVFDFNTALNAPPPGKGGVISASNVDNFPALVGFPISTTIGVLNACGLNTPHVHPRATEFLTVVEGSLDSGFILENGFTTEIDTTLSKFQGTIFPMGSIHFQLNPNCEDAVFVAALDSNDPGVSQIAQNFFALNGDIVNATLGFPESLDGKDIDAFKNQIPANVALGVESCLAKCGIEKRKN